MLKIAIESVKIERIIIMLNILSEKTEKVAITPLKINLQLFAEEEIPEADEAKTDDNFDFEQSMKDAQTKEDKGVKEEVADPKPPKTEQNADENAKFAAARRDAEAKAKVIDDEREQTAKDIGYESWKDFQDAVKQQKETTQKAEFQEKFGLDPEVVSEAFKNTPEYKEFQQYKTETTAKEQKVIAEKNINDAITQLNESFGLELKTGDDLNAIPNAIAIEALLKAKNADGTNVYTIVEAYKMANGADIIKKNSAAIAQATLNKINSKAHLKGNDGVAELENNTISNEELEIAKRFGFSEAEFRKNYNK